MSSEDTSYEMPELVMKQVEAADLHSLPVGSQVVMTILDSDGEEEYITFSICREGVMCFGASAPDYCRNREFRLSEDASSVEFVPPRNGAALTMVDEIWPKGIEILRFDSTEQEESSLDETSDMAVEFETASQIRISEVPVGGSLKIKLNNKWLNLKKINELGECQVLSGDFPLYGEASVFFQGPLSIGEPAAIEVKPQSVAGRLGSNEGEFCPANMNEGDRITLWVQNNYLELVLGPQNRLLVVSSSLPYLKGVEVDFDILRQPKNEALFELPEIRMMGNVVDLKALKKNEQITHETGQERQSKWAWISKIFRRKKKEETVEGDSMEVSQLSEGDRLELFLEGGKKMVVEHEGEKDHEYPFTLVKSPFPGYSYQSRVRITSPQVSEGKKVGFEIGPSVVKGIRKSLNPKNREISEESLIDLQSLSVNKEVTFKCDFQTFTIRKLNDEGEFLVVKASPDYYTHRKIRFSNPFLVLDEALEFEFLPQKMSDKVRRFTRGVSDMGIVDCSLLEVGESVKLHIKSPKSAHLFLERVNVSADTPFEFELEKLSEEGTFLVRKSDVKSLEGRKVHLGKTVLQKYKAPGLRVLAETGRLKILEGHSEGKGLEDIKKEQDLVVLLGDNRLKLKKNDSKRGFRVVESPLGMGWEKREVHLHPFAREDGLVRVHFGLVDHSDDYGALFVTKRVESRVDDQMLTVIDETRSGADLQILDADESAEFAHQLKVLESRSSFKRELSELFGAGEESFPVRKICYSPEDEQKLNRELGCILFKMVQSLRSGKWRPEMSELTSLLEGVPRYIFDSIKFGSASEKVHSTTFIYTDPERYMIELYLGYNDDGLLVDFGIEPYEEEEMVR